MPKESLRTYNLESERYLRSIITAIEQERERLQLSKTDMAHHLGITSTTFFKLYAHDANPTLLTLLYLADRMNITLRQLLFLAETGR